MAYAVYSDIENEFKALTLNSTSTIKDTEVTQFIAETDAIINATLFNRYVTPVTGATSLLILKKICIDYVAYRVAKILEIKKAIPIPDNNTVQELTEGSAYKESKELLKNIQKGLIVLPDAIKTKSDYGISSYTSENNIEPFFKKEETQW